MTDNFFLNIKVLVAKVLKKKGTSDMIPLMCLVQFFHVFDHVV
jgi:hypothetical protein